MVACGARGAWPAPHLLANQGPLPPFVCGCACGGAGMFVGVPAVVPAAPRPTSATRLAFGTRRLRRHVKSGRFAFGGPPPACDLVLRAIRPHSRGLRNG